MRGRRRSWRSGSRPSSRTTSWALAGIGALSWGRRGAPVAKHECFSSHPPALVEHQNLGAHPPDPLAEGASPSALPRAVCWPELRVSTRRSWSPCGPAASAGPSGRRRPFAFGLGGRALQVLLLLIQPRDATVDAAAQPLQPPSQEAVPAMSESEHLFSHLTPPFPVAEARRPGYVGQLAAEATATLRAKL